MSSITFFLAATVVESTEPAVLRMLALVGDAIAGIAALVAALIAGWLFRIRKREDDARFYADSLPTLSVVSPSCDLSQNRCETNLIGNSSPGFEDRGDQLLAIVNYSNRPAYSVELTISPVGDFSNTDAKNVVSRYDEIPRTPIPIPDFDDVEHHAAMVYSKWRLLPGSGRAATDELNLASFVKQCSADLRECDRLMYVRLDYHSSPLKNRSVGLRSEFKICLDCPDDETVRINYIMRMIDVELRVSRLHALQSFFVRGSGE